MKRLTPGQWGVVSYCGGAGILAWLASGPFPDAVPWIIGGATGIGVVCAALGYGVRWLWEWFQDGSGEDWP